MFSGLMCLCRIGSQSGSENQSCCRRRPLGASVRVSSRWPSCSHDSAFSTLSSTCQHRPSGRNCVTSSLSGVVVLGFTGYWLKRFCSVPASQKSHSSIRCADTVAFAVPRPHITLSAIVSV